MDLLANKKCAQIAWTYLDCHEYKFWKYFTFGLRLHGPFSNKKCSGCIDLYDGHFVVRLHGMTWSVLCSAFCTQVTWTYFACVNSQHRGLWICHFVLRAHGPIWLPFCAQVVGTYIVGVFCSGCVDLLYIYILHLNITMLPSSIPTNHSTHSMTVTVLWAFFTAWPCRPSHKTWGPPFCKLWHYKI